jgi:hypothetical protein
MAKRILYTQRTLKELRKRGLVCGIVERFNQFGGQFGVRIDLFGFVDLLAMDIIRRKIVAIQSTGQHGHAAHKKKIVGECRKNAKLWLRCGGLIELWSWRKLLVKRGGKQRQWVPRIEQITLETMRSES